MGVKVREKPKGSGVYWIFIEHQGRRKAKKIGKDKRLANKVAKKIEAKLTLGDLRLLNDKESTILFNDYADQWLGGYVKTALKASTYRGYKSIVKLHLKPKFRNQPLGEITRNEIKQFLFEKIKQGLSFGRIKRIKASLSGIFTQAIEDGLVKSNPAAKLDKLLNAKDQALGKEISPYNAWELEKYLETAQLHYPQYYPILLTTSVILQVFIPTGRKQKDQLKKLG